MTNYQKTQLKYSKQALMKLLGYQSLSSVYQLLEATLLPKKLYYSEAEFNRLQISKALLAKKKTRAEIKQYWAEYLALKSY